MNADNILEQCITVLTNIVNRQNQPIPIRTTIEKEAQYISCFEGRSGTLPGFITAVERMMVQHGEPNVATVFEVIYNMKITGAAKNYLETSPPATWTECKAKLKLHFKPAKEQRQIVKEINGLKVSSILELVNKVRSLVNDIAECSIFDSFQAEIANQLGSILVIKIKEVTAGTLAAELHDKYRLEEIREIMNKYIDQDHFNLKFVRNNPVAQQNNNCNSRNNSSSNNNLNNNNNSNGYTYNNNRNYNGNFQNQRYHNNRYQVNRNDNNHNSGQNRPNNNYNSGQYRPNNNNNNQSGQRRNFSQYQNNNQPVTPMEVDTLNTRENNKVSTSEEFFIN